MTEDLRDPVFRPEDEALRIDVGRLGALLGEVLQEQAGQELFAWVEAVRQASIRRRRGEEAAASELEERLAGHDPVSATQLVRAFSSYFALVNMAEQVHRIRRRREYLRDPGAAQAGSLRRVVRDLAAAGVAREQLQATLAGLRVEPVFTAHPTEATRRTILAKEQRICRLLVDRHQQLAMTPAEERSWWGRLREEITQSWQTAEQAPDRPTVADEVEHATFFLSEIIYPVVPAFYEELELALAESFPGGDKVSVDGPILHFASWVGGDMDGNPNVGAATIEATLKRQQELVLERYRRELRKLFDHLSQSRSRVVVSADLEARIGQYRELMPEAASAIPQRYRDMPYRLLLWLMWERLGGALRGDAGAYRRPQELEEDLQLIADSLRQHRGRHAGLFGIERLRRRVQCFGFHLATLDLRQDAELHRQALAQLLGEPAFVAAPPSDRVSRLHRALEEGVEAVDPRRLEDPARTVLEAMAAFGRARQHYGAAAVGPLIISMARDADDVLAVLVLARAAGAVDENGQVPFHVAPLFETVQDLETSTDTLRAICDDPLYRSHLEQRGGGQLVMLGYSDSSKISGLAASRWALYRAQEELVAVAEESGVHLSFFHGRGGTASRGGSKTRQAILADPCGAVRGRVRVTEQGEIINLKYGLRGIAERSLELLTGSVLEASVLCDRQGAVPVSWCRAMETVARVGRRAYDRLVHEDGSFVPYFRAATPIDVIERMPIGSRPASRRSGGGVENLRAIPWVFAWTQSRLLLPGWLGVGEGLEAAVAEHGEELLKEMAGGWPFFTNLLADVEMVLAKADLDIAGRYAALAGAAGAPMFGRIREQFAATEELVLRLRGHGELLEAEPVLQRSIRLRNPYVDPMSLLQVDLLARWRESEREDRELERALFATVRGIARGLRNTG